MTDGHPRTIDFYFIRHAPVVKRSGHLPPHDPDITAGPFDLTALIDQLPANADWHVSPLNRTQQTAALLTPTLAPHTISLDEQVVEMDFGSWDERPVADVWQELERGPKHNWSFITPDTMPPEGESFRMQCQRISTWMDSIAEAVFANPENRDQIVITHSGVVRAVMRHVLQCDPEMTIGIPVTHFGCLKVTCMEPRRAVDAGGVWQLSALIPHTPQVL